MSALDRVRERFGTPRENSKPLPVGTAKTAERAFGSSGSSQGKGFRILAAPIDMEKARRDIARRADARERRRQKVLAILEANPELTHAWHTDDSTDPVTVAVAVRGIGAAELAIDADRFDPFALVEVTHGGKPQ